MSDAIIVALITSGCTLFGTVLAIISTNRKTNENLKISQAVTDTKIDELTREVRAHNNFAQRMPVVESQIQDIKEDTERLGRRVEAIEKRGA